MDFYQYANGAWRAANPIPPFMTRWSRVHATAEATKGRLKEITEDVSRSSDWPCGSVEQLIGDYYVACTDQARIDRLGLTPMKSWLDEIDRMKNAADLQRVLRHLHEIGITAPFALSSDADPHNPAQTIAFLSAAGLGLPDRDYYLKPEERFVKIREQYRDHVATMFSLAGATWEQAKAAARAVLHLETKLAEASLDNVAIRDPHATDHPTTFKGLKQLAPAMDWDGYFRGAKVPRANLIVAEPSFLRAVDRQLRQTPLADWKTYLKWHFLHQFVGSLPTPFVAEDFRLTAALSGATQLKPRADRCAQQEDRLLGEALGRKYVEKYFPPAPKARIQELVQNELAAMHEIIENLDWMSLETKKRALAKLAQMTVKVGYPDKWKDYRGVKITRDSYWDDVVAATRWNVDDERSLIGKPTDRKRWLMTVPTSDAYNDYARNEIAFPAGILLPPQFNPDAVDAVNYGGIGIPIGHEISHGFDDEGAKYDQEGRLNIWWTAADLKGFQQRTACVERQFDNYFIEPGLHHSGKLVLGESIARLGRGEDCLSRIQEGSAGPACSND